MTFFKKYLMKSLTHSHIHFLNSLSIQSTCWREILTNYRTVMKYVSCSQISQTKTCFLMNRNVLTVHRFLELSPTSLPGYTKESFRANEHKAWEAVPDAEKATNIIDTLSDISPLEILTHSEKDAALLLVYSPFVYLALNFQCHLILLSTYIVFIYCNFFFFQIVR